MSKWRTDFENIEVGQRVLCSMPKGYVVASTWEERYKREKLLADAWMPAPERYVPRPEWLITGWSIEGKLGGCGARSAT